MIGTIINETDLVLSSTELFLNGVSFFILGCGLGLAVFLFYYQFVHLPYKKEMNQKLEEGQEKANRKESPKPKSKDSVKRTHMFFNGNIEYTETKRSYAIALTDLGLERLRSIGTVDEAILFTQGIFDGFEFVGDHRINGYLLTDCGRATAFRWYIYHCLNRIATLYTSSTENKEEEAKKDVEGISYEEQKEDFDEFVEDLNNKQEVPDAGDTGINNSGD